MAISTETIRDWAWADGHLGEITRCLRSVAGEILNIHQATDKQDLYEATDYVVVIGGGGLVAVRVRDANKPWRDFTIRASRPSGVITELEKLRTGYGRWYLYAWARGGVFEEWLLVDLDVLRSSGLLDRPERRRNRDGTQFLPLDIPAITTAGALIHYERGYDG